LSIGANAKLDLNDNDLLLDYTGITPLAAVQSLINAARSGGAWSGNGLTSQARAARDRAQHHAGGEWRRRISRASTAPTAMFDVMRSTPRRCWSSTPTTAMPTSTGRSTSTTTSERTTASTTT
jgi:hypothetical protein